MKYSLDDITKFSDDYIYNLLSINDVNITENKDNNLYEAILLFYMSGNLNENIYPNYINISKFLLWASLDGYKEIVKLLLNGNKDEALIHASRNGDFGTTKLLLENGANVHTKSDLPLEVASKNGHLEVVKLLSQYNEDINIIPLELAAGNGHLEVVKFLSENGPVSDRALLISSGRNHFKIVKFLLEKNKQNVYINESLIIASEHGYTKIVKLLLEQVGVNVNAENGKALKKASANGHLEVVKLLIKNGANVNVSNSSPLVSASWHGHLEIVKLLLKNGAEVTTRSLERASPKITKLLQSYK